MPNDKGMMYHLLSHALDGCLTVFNPALLQASGTVDLNNCESPKGSLSIVNAESTQIFSLSGLQRLFPGLKKDQVLSMTPDGPSNAAVNTNTLLPLPMD